MGVITSKGSNRDQIESAMDVVDVIPATAYPTTDFNYMSATQSGNVVTFRHEKDGVFQFNIVVTNALTSPIWEVNTTP